MKKIFALIAAVVLAALAMTGCTSVAPLCASSDAVRSKVEQQHGYLEFQYHYQMTMVFKLL